MPQSPVLGAAQVTLDYQSDSGDARNVLNFSQVPFGEWRNTNLEAVANAVYTWWAASLKQHVASAFRLEKITARDLANVPGEVFDRVVNEPGGNGQPRSPGNVTTAFTLRTALGGRSGRGRIFHIGLTSGYYTGDVLNASELTQLLTAYNALKVLSGGGTSGEYHLAVVSRFGAGVQRPQGLTNDVTAVTNDGFLDSQRRRLRGRGA
jgi:hypothetical protein